MPVIIISDDEWLRMLPLDSDLLRTFLAVADNGNVTRAAEHVGRTQSAISMQVKRLEEMLGEPLFARGPRGVTLTGRGDQLLPYARRIVGLVEEAGTALRAKPLEGPVRIGIPEEYAPRILPRALAAFAERHPAVDVTVRSATSRQHLAYLEKDELDLALVFASELHTSDETLCIDPTVWAMSRAHRLDQRDPVPVAVFGSFTWCSEMALASLRQHGIPFRVAYTSEALAGLISVASAGLAIASLSRSTIPADCRELTAEDGYPPIDSSRVVLKRNPRRSGAAIDGMVETIRQTFLPAGEPGRA